MDVQLANAEADYKLENNDFQNGEKFGNYVCIRAKEIVEQSNGKFAIQIINDDEGVLGLQHFQIEFASSDCDLNSLSVEGGTLGEQVKADTYLYHVEKGDSDSITLTADITGTQLLVDDQPCEDLTFTVSKFTRPTCLTIVAEDTVTKQNYYIIYKENEKDLYFTQSQDAKDKAKELLKAWEERSDRDKKNLASNGYWGTLMAASTSTSSNGISLDGAVAKDIFRAIKENSDQATTYAAIIMELVALGENPYDYKGGDKNITNYVEKLKTYSEGGSYGAFANNIWALMAYRAAGEIPEESL